jgi:hypothetical protein
MLTRDCSNPDSREGMFRSAAVAQQVMLFYNNVAELRQILGGCALKIRYNEVRGDNGIPPQRGVEIPLSLVWA